MLAPEEWHRVESLAAPQQISRGGLPLPFCHDPMLNPDVIRGVRIGPAGNVAGREYTCGARFQVLVHENSAIDLEISLLRQFDTRLDSDADRDHVGFDSAPIVQRHSVSVDPRHRPPQVKHDSLRLVKPLDKSAKLRPQHAFHRHMLGRDDVYFEFASAQ